LVEKKYILAYDHGTSGMKTAIVSTTGEIIGFSVSEYELFHPEPGAAEQNPADWWNALVKTTHNLLEKKLVPVEDIVACITSNQMDGTIPIDEKGNVLFNCITWMDTRGADAVKKLCGGPISGYSIGALKSWLPATGAAPGLSGKDILAHILWLRDTHPDIYEKAWKFLDCKDYLTYRLSGEICTSYDCAILSFIVNDTDINNIHYDPALVKKTGIDLNKMPPLKPSIYVAGNILPEVAKELGLSPNTKVVLGAGDMATAAVGSGAVLDGQTHICIGSSSWMITHIPVRKVDINHFVGSIPSAIPGRYMAAGEQEAAGINLTWLRDKVLYHKDQLLKDEKVPDVYKIFDQMVADVKPGDKKVIFTPWMFGERSPVEDHTIRGGLYNIGLDVDRRHVIRAIFEGIAFNNRWLLMYLEKLALPQLKGLKQLDHINIVGGGGMSSVWCQIFADVLNRKVRQMPLPKEGNSIGAGFIASVALGYITWEQIPDLLPFKKEYEPRPEYRKLYDELFQEFVNIYNNNKKMYKRLNRTH
jgi:xylulokinase